MIPHKRSTRVILFALSVQLVAVLIGFYILYHCTDRGIPEHNISETAYWGTIGLLGFMFLGMAVPLTGFVVLVASILIWSGLNWRRGWFLWPIGFILWGLYWVALTYE